MTIRPSILAGSWYSEDPETLSDEIQSYLNKAEVPEIYDEIRGIISPHAGYVYSGQTAAYGYKTLLGRFYDLIVILSPLHRFTPAAYVTQEAETYRTPLGEIPVDQNAIELLSDSVPLYPVIHDQEHSIEIQLPFLQSVLHDFKILPIMIGHSDVCDVDDMVQGLVKLSKRKKTLFLASSDLHHIDNYDQVVKRDNEVIQTIQDYDLSKLRKIFSSRSCSVCGKTGISIMMDVLNRTGVGHVEILNATNSGDVTGEKSPGKYTVGYLSAALT